MAYIVDDYDEDVMHARTFGMVTREDMSFLNRLNESVSHVGEIGSRYLRRSAELFEGFDFEGIRDKLKSVTVRWKNRFATDEVIELTSISDLQGARPKMRRYAMAMPRLRDLYLKGRVEGFGDNFEMEDRYADHTLYKEYREVMNGAFTGDDDRDEWTTHLDVFDDNGYEELSFEEKLVIREGWASIAQWLDEQDEDPTSMTGAKL